MKTSLSFLLAFVALVAPPLAVVGRLSDQKVEEVDRWLTDSGNDDEFGTDAPTSPPPAFFCFSEVSTVEELTLGKLAMKDLKVGDKVLTKSGQFQTVFAFAHKQESATGRFLQFHSKELEAPLEVTQEHLIYLHNKANPVRADSIQVGDELETIAGPAQVTKITNLERDGLYVPLTLDGTVVVDGVVSSSYISFHQDFPEQIAGVPLHDFIHMTLAPFRMICFGVSSSLCEWQDEQKGMPHYISFGAKLHEWFLSQNKIVQLLALIVVVSFTGACWAVESLFGAVLSPMVIATCCMAFYAYQSKNRSCEKMKSL